MAFDLFDAGRRMTSPSRANLDVRPQVIHVEGWIHGSAPDEPNSR